MSSYDDTAFHPSPASSSGVVDSGGGTSHTSPTAFSPEDVRAMKAAAINLSGRPTGSGQQDPFMSSGAQTGGRLSAKASAFKPSFEIISSTPDKSIAIESSLNHKAPKPPNQVVKNITGPHSLSSAPTLHNVNSTHFGAFTTDTTTSRVLKVTGRNAVATFLPFVEASKRKLRERGVAKRGSERPEQLGNSYYLRLANIHDATELYSAIKMDNPGLIVEYVSPVTFGELFSPGRYSIHEGQVLLTMNYPSESQFDEKLLEDSLIQMLEGEGKLCAWHKVASTEDNTFHMLAEFEDASCASEVVSHGRKVNNDAKLQNVTLSIDLFRPDLAERIIFQQIYNPTTPTRYPEEDTDLHNAFSNMSLGNFTHSPESPGKNHAGTSPNASSLPYVPNPSRYPLPNGHSFILGGVDSLYMSPAINSFHHGYAPRIEGQLGLGESVVHTLKGHNTSPQDGFRPRGFESVTGFQHSNMNNEIEHYDQRLHHQTLELSHYSLPAGRRQFVSRGTHIRSRQHTSPANSHHNHVDIAKIRQGIDVRTTVMLRNIPNKVDQAMLKEIMDESSFGRYDFMYLRIDFSNNCNVGYAFINFTDPLDIIDFVVARSNQKWHRFKSDKVAEVSYATIQGKDCLVQKFRNSSVMLEPPHYRPKLFKTIHDQFGRAGEEEDFPESDNASKLKRSCENAEHVGLFAPSAGQHLRDEQRRRRSQYDRGTSLAEREENGFDDHFYHQFGFPPY